MTFLRLFELKKWQKSGLGGRAHLLHHLELVEGRKSNIPALVFFAVFTSKSDDFNRKESPTENEIHPPNRLCLGRLGGSNSLFLCYVSTGSNNSTLFL